MVKEFNLVKRFNQVVKGFNQVVKPLTTWQPNNTVNTVQLQPTAHMKQAPVRDYARLLIQLVTNT